MLWVGFNAAILVLQHVCGTFGILSSMCLISESAVVQFGCEHGPDIYITMQQLCGCVFACVIQLCENQQNDLQVLQLNLESARQALKQHDGR